MMTMNRANAIATIIEENTGLEATAQEVRKGDFIEVGITVGKPDVKIRPNIYLSQFEDLPDEQIADRVIEIYEEHKDGMADFDPSTYTDYEKAKQNFRLCIRPQTSNEEDIKQNYLDLELFVKCEVAGGNITVKKNHVEMWGVDESEIFEVAKINSRKEYTIDGMLDVIRELGRKDLADELSDDFEVKPMYVIGNTKRMLGAGAIANTDFLANFASKIGNFYIIPSSIHECLVIPERFVDNTAYMKSLIADVNNYQVAPEERLSYNLYYFNGNEVEIVA